MTDKLTSEELAQIEKLEAEIKGKTASKKSVDKLAAQGKPAFVEKQRKLQAEINDRLKQIAAIRNRHIDSTTDLAQVLNVQQVPAGSMQAEGAADQTEQPGAGDLQKNWQGMSRMEQRAYLAAVGRGEIQLEGALGDGQAQAVNPTRPIAAPQFNPPMQDADGDQIMEGPPAVVVGAGQQNQGILGGMQAFQAQMAQMATLVPELGAAMMEPEAGQPQGPFAALERSEQQNGVVSTGERNDLMAEIIKPVDQEPIMKFAEKCKKMLSSQTGRLAYVHNKNKFMAGVPQERAAMITGLQLAKIERLKSTLAQKKGINSGPLIESLEQSRTLIEGQDSQAQTDAMIAENVNKLDQAFQADLTQLFELSKADTAALLEELRQKLDDPTGMMEELDQRRKKKRKELESKQMNRGMWQPYLPKGFAYMPSEWVGDFDWTHVFDVSIAERDQYYRVYNELTREPQDVYEKLKDLILRNKDRMTRQYIPIVADGPTKITVHNKVTIEVVHGDVIKDVSDIKCGTINWHLNPGEGLAASFVRFGGGKIADELARQLAQLKGTDHAATGGVAITNPHGIAHAKKLFFIVGPKFSARNMMQDDQFLRMCTMNALQAAMYVKPNCTSIAIPGISIGEIFRFPLRRCARLMIEMCINWSTLVTTNGIRHIKLINWKKEEYQAFCTEMQLVQQELDAFPRFQEFDMSYGLQATRGPAMFSTVKKA